MAPQLRDFAERWRGRGYEKGQAEKIVAHLFHLYAQATQNIPSRYA